MTPRRRILESLAACLRGEPPEHCDWIAVMEAANQGLVTPALAVALLDVPVPDDVSTYLAFILDRNRERNERLRTQLAESAGALNAHGIVPTVLKGGAWLLTAAAPEAGQRMITDLDIMVPIPDMSRTLSVLAELGYVVDSEAADPSHQFQADLRRPSDAAMVDLHRRPPGPAVLHDLEDLRKHCAEVRCGEARVLVPSPTYQAMHLLAHDLFHDGDYWLGQIDLRHLLDLRALAQAGGGIDFGHLRSLMPGRLAGRALAAQLLALHALLGVDVPRAFLQDRAGRIQHRRRLLQLDRPYLRWPLTILTILAEWGAYQEMRRLNGAAGAKAGAKDSRAGGRSERWKRLLTSDGMGKL